ncbi:hypothetical protein C3L33_15047, partial [Rhododendron williamsianum]
MCTLEKSGGIFLLTINGLDEHRVNPALISSLRSSLRQARDQSTRGCALVTKHQGKQVLLQRLRHRVGPVRGRPGGGTAYDHLVKLSELYGPVVADFVSLPMPTIAAVTGHAAAAGLMLPLSHDYVLMKGDRGVMYFSELDWGKCSVSFKN